MSDCKVSESLGYSYHRRVVHYRPAGVRTEAREQQGRYPHVLLLLVLIPSLLLLLLVSYSSSFPSSPPSFPVLESPCAVDPLQLHMSSHPTLLSSNFPFSASLLFTQKSCSAFPSKQRGASVRRGETKSYLSPSSNTLQPKISLPTP